MSEENKKELEDKKKKAEESAKFLKGLKEENRKLKTENETYKKQIDKFEEAQKELLETLEIDDEGDVIEAVEELTKNKGKVEADDKNMSDLQDINKTLKRELSKQKAENAKLKEEADKTKIEAETYKRELHTKTKEELIMEDLLANHKDYGIDKKFIPAMADIVKERCDIDEYGELVFNDAKGELRMNADNGPVTIADDLKAVCEMSKYQPFFEKKTETSGGQLNAQDIPSKKEGQSAGFDEHNLVPFKDKNEEYEFYKSAG